VLAFLVIAAIGVTVWLYYSRPAAAPIDSIAVMPLLNQTGNPESEYLSDGITESLIGRLSQIPNLSVMARSSVFRFKGKDVGPKEIGKDLNVPAILTGRVSRNGNTFSLYIELVDAATEKVVWNAEYNRPESNLTTIPGEIARDVAENLRKKLSGGDEQNIVRNYTDNSAAYELYLKGRYYWDKRNEEAYKVAEDAYKQAIALDPNYALAYAGLADCYLFREIGLGRDVAMPLAKQYALKALELDESLAEAHTTLAFVNANYDLDFASGEKEFKRAIELKPNYAIAHQFYGAQLVAMGRIDDGLAEMRKAVDLEPYTAAINWSLGMGLGSARRYDESIAQLQKTLQIQPDYALAEGSLTGMLIQSGRYDDAMALVQKHLALPERRDGALSNLAVIYAKTGRMAEARKALVSLLGEGKSQNNPYSVAKVYTALGEKDKAIEWLDKAVERRSFSVWFMRVDPFFDSLHGDPGYEELIRRIGLQN
jgi:TolB-like protein/Tfp pilus assembly protein PilF